MGNIRTIVTHPGSAHKDEFLAICLAVYKTGCTHIERRVADDGDLSDPSVMVIDQGKRYEPQLNNFDHHHDANLQSAYPLVAQHFGLDAALQLADKSYRNVDIEDRKGPMEVATSLGLSITDYNSLADPIGGAVLGVFSGYKEVPQEFVSVMKAIGENMVVRAEQYQQDYNRLEAIPIQEVDGIRYFIDPSEKSVAREDVAREKGAAIIVSPNGRDGGWKLKRMDDHPRIDFRRAKDLPDLDPSKTPKSFVHANGFFAATTNTNADIAAIVTASLISPELVAGFTGKHPRREVNQPDGSAMGKAASG